MNGANLKTVYQPSAPWVKNSHLQRFIDQCGFSTYADLLRFSQDHVEDFWALVLKDMNLRFSKGYEKLLAEGLPWPRWAYGAELSIVENCIDRHLNEFANHPALIFESDELAPSTTWTYQDLARESSWVAHQLIQSGAKPGMRAALLMPMSLEMVASFFGILRAGLSVIPIFSGYGSEAIATRLQDASVDFVFLQSKTTRRGREVPVKKTLDEILPLCPTVKNVFLLEREDFLKGHLEQAIIPSLARPAESECLLLYTSGTTGKPKACVHTPFGVLATTGKELRYGFDVHRDDRFFWYTDIGWMMGPWELFGVLQYGATVVLYEGVPDYPTSSRLWEIVENHHVTHLGISPTAVRVLRKGEETGPARFQFSNLRILGSTGEPWDEETWTWFFENVGKSRCPILNISGGTEIMGCHLMPNPLSELRPMTLSGPALGMKVEAWSESGKRLTQGLGHLVCLTPSPSMTKGFLGNPQKYLDTYFSKFGEHVWYHGDWAWIDDAGFWYLRGRSDDTIKIAGKRVGPNEFESALMEDHRVAEAAAVGLPHDIKGECVHCFVVMKSSDLKSEEVRKELANLAVKTMGKALAPEKIFFVDSLPKTRSGKILRGLIRKIVLKETFDDSSVDQVQTITAIQKAS